MPTPNSVGNTAFREHSVEEYISFDGPDTLVVTLRGAATDLQAERNKWKRGQTYPGYKTVFLQTKNSVDRGPACDLVLSFLGYIEATDTNNGVIDISDDIAEESVTITTSTGENVNFRYFAQISTTRWLSRSATIPSRPRFPGVVPTSLPIGLLRQPNPPNYTGSISGQYKLEGVLAGFQRVRLAKSVWAVVETWKNLVEPVAS